MASFEFDRTVTCEADAGEVWALVTDVPRLVDWIGVLHDAETVAPLESYRAVISDKVGLIALRADLDVRVTDQTPGRRIVVRAEGTDRQIGSRITIEATVSLVGEGPTEVRVHGSYAITGRAATLGASTIKRKGEKVLSEFCDNLRAAGAARPA